MLLTFLNRRYIDLVDVFESLVNYFIWFVDGCSGVKRGWQYRPLRLTLALLCYWYEKLFRWAFLKGH